MITSTNIVIFILFVCLTIILLIFKSKKKKIIGLVLTVVFFMPVVFFNVLWNSKYYFSYQKFYNEFDVIKQVNIDNFLITPTCLEEKDFQCYHREIWFGEEQEMSASFVLDSTNYEQIKNEQTIEIDDINLLEGEEITGLQNEAFKTYGEELVQKVARENLEKGNYYFLKFYHNPHLVYGIIMNDDTQEIIQFYFCG